MPDFVPTAIVALVIVTAGLFHLPLWYLLVWILGLTNILLIVFLYTPRRGFRTFGALFEIVWAPLMGVFDHSQLHFPKPYLCADGEGSYYRKEVPPTIRRSVFIIGTSMAVDSTGMPLATIFCFLLILSFLLIFRELLVGITNPETAIEPSDSMEHDGSDSAKLISRSSCSSDRWIFIAIAIAIFTLSLLFINNASIPPLEIFAIFTFAAVTDSQSQIIAMILARRICPFSFDGLIDYAVLGVMIFLDFILCVKLFVQIVYHSYGLIAICLSYCNAFAAVMEFSTKVWALVSDELSLLSSMKRANSLELRVHNDVCAICLGKMHSARWTPCNHLFHGKCLRLSLRRNTSCPLCQSALVVTHNAGHAINVF